MALNQLPVEIILLITKSLLGDTKTLANLATYTKRLHQILIPVLYSHITVICKLAPISMWDGWSLSLDGLSGSSRSEDGLSELSASDDGQEYIQRPSVGDQQIRNLTRTILHNPHLASHVRSFDASDLFHEPWVDRKLPQPDAMEHQSITTKADPDLQRLLDAVQILKKPEDTMDQKQWSDFCRRWQGTLKANACNSDPQLAVLLAHLPALRTFKLETFAKSCSGFTIPLLNHLAGGKDLSGARPIPGSLTRLFVQNPQVSNSPPRLEVEMRTIQTLSYFYVEFQTLTSLHIAAQYLVGKLEEWNQYEWPKIDYTTWVINANIALYKRLPESLQVLHIMIPEGREEFDLLVESVREMIRMRKLRSAPHLREIRLEAPFEGDGSAFGVLSMQNEASDAGIRLRNLDTSRQYSHSWIRDISKTRATKWFDTPHVHMGLDGELTWENRPPYNQAVE
ncbi:uncharacterized protein N7496_012321 [Penicillium cataractarum]|uniref:Uncharacterized protein n=1 Tax=Penicillium cataractarum TaxID=2100454 RepID=A0A9W9R9D7_9EURO|nr:uncharacterized protein N7496_012321 [Penicillium cataractarum]KAJ5355109.1 hypothetical protein N7496_012321 [Penicillium cataractarum]